MLWTVLREWNQNVNLDKIMDGITKLKDNDGDWYWIPNEKVKFFNNDIEAMSILTYMDNPERFDDFNEDYGHFATGGDPDLMPDFFKKTLPIKYVPNMFKDMSPDEVIKLWNEKGIVLHNPIDIPITKEVCLGLGMELVVWDEKSNGGYFVKSNFKFGINSTTDGFCTISQNDNGNQIIRFSGIISNKSELEKLMQQIEVPNE